VTPANPDEEIPGTAQSRHKSVWDEEEEEKKKIIKYFFFIIN